MRSSGCSTFQQALTHEASIMVKQAVTLARRRGHAQVTPLHVAQAMLSASSSLLRAACLQSHSHPFQCRALELCFNVALNRLPTSTSTSSMLGQLHSSYQPTISNALIAAFKRAQAHQRRGTIENQQQQPILVVKIELEQLIISILDDPSVSRVMREAGFSSTMVKGKVEQALSLELSSSSRAPPHDHHDQSPNPNGTVKYSIKQLLQQDQAKDDEEDHNMMAATFIESLVNNIKTKRSIVLVGECASTLEGVVRQVMDKVDKGHEVDQVLKQVKFVQLPLHSFGHCTREEVDQRLWEIKCLVKGCLDNNKGVILYLGDLKWAVEIKYSSMGLGDLDDRLYHHHHHHHQVISSYCPVDHMIVELGSLLSSYGDKERLWLMGIATFQTYMRCRNGHSNSLETIWGLHAITFPVARNLRLSLSDVEAGSLSLMGSKKAGNGATWLSLEGGGTGDQEIKGAIARSPRRCSSTSNMNSTAGGSNLPSWLQEYKDEIRRSLASNHTDDKETVPVNDLCKKWDSMISKSIRDSDNIQPAAADQSFERTISFSSSALGFPYNQQCSSFQPQPQGIQYQSYKIMEPIPYAFSDQQQNYQKHAAAAAALSFFSISTPNISTPNSTSSSEINMEIDSTTFQRSTLKAAAAEYNDENLKIMCNALEKVAGPDLRKEIILEIASTVLTCRSGITRGSRRRKIRNGDDQKQDTWLLFHGMNNDGKEKISKELARLVFGSERRYMSISLMSNFSSSNRGDSSADSRNKRVRDDEVLGSYSYVERFAGEISRDPHRVFFLEDFEQVEYSSQMSIVKAIETGKITIGSGSGEEVSFVDAIVILSCESGTDHSRSNSRCCSPTSKKMVHMEEEEEEEEEEEDARYNCVSLDLNVCINDDGDDGIIGGDQFVDEIGLLGYVDSCILFKVSDYEY